LIFKPFAPSSPQQKHLIIRPVSTEKSEQRRRNGLNIMPVYGKNSGLKRKQKQPIQKNYR